MLSITIPLPRFIGPRNVHLFDGFSADQLTYLVIMSFVFPGRSDHQQPILQEHQHPEGSAWASACCAACATSLYDRILRFPSGALPQGQAGRARDHDQGRGSSHFGGFIGDAYVQPMFLGGQALTAIIFIMLQKLDS